MRYDDEKEEVHRTKMICFLIITVSTIFCIAMLHLFAELYTDAKYVKHTCHRCGISIWQQRKHKIQIHHECDGYISKIYME